MRTWLWKLFDFRKDVTSNKDTEIINTDYSSDVPISSKHEDRFNRSGFASRIAETLAKRVDPSSIVIGLYGVWGDGKTSVLEMMSETLEEHANVIVIRFNPWNFQSEELLLKGFFSTLAQSLDASLPNLKEKAGGLLTRYGALLSLAAAPAGAAAKSLGETLSSVSIDTLRKRIDKILADNKKRIVVLVDDIDRLDRAETHAIFKLVKLSASFQFTSYVLAFDEDVVSAALGERYGQGGQDAGRAFLEKIIQVPLHLPPADTASLRQLAFEGLEKALAQAEIEINRETVDTFARHFIVGLEHRLTTPRLAKLYSNAVMFALPLLKGEVNIAELMLIEGLRIFYPKLYVAILENPEVFLKRDENRRQNPLNPQQKNSVDELVVNNMPGSTEKERYNVRHGLLEEIFPRIKNTIFGPEWDRVWARQKRICTEEYFQRYFTYGIPDGDVSDQQIRAFIEALTADEATVSSHLKRFAENKAIPKLVSKLRDFENELPENQAKSLCLNLSCNANVLPIERGAMVYSTTRMQCGILISRLLRRVQAGPQRQELAETVINAANPIEFGMECLRWTLHYDERPEEERILTEEGDLAIKNAMATRIKIADSAAPIYLLAPRDAPSLYSIWKGQFGGADVEGALLSRFTDHPAEVDQFLDRFVGEGWLMETGLPVRSDFERRSYENVAQLISPDYIASNLRERYKEAVLNPTFPQAQDTPIALRIANQFLYIYTSHNIRASDESLAE